MVINKRGQSGNFALFVLVLIVVGIFVTVAYVVQQTVWFNNAQGPSNNAVTNINRASEIISTINPDGTMGPQTSAGNWSSALPEALTGKLVFAVTDPPQGGKPDNTGESLRPTESFHSDSVLPTQAQGKPTNGPQEVSALTLNISKVEVHLSYQGETNSNDQHGPVDHWETLNISSPFTVELVSLAKNNDIAALGLTDLAAGHYTEVRLYIRDATAKLTDGTIAVLQLSGRDNIVKVVQPFRIVEGGTTSLVLDFDAQRSVIKAGSQFLLRPVVAKLIEEHAVLTPTP